MRKWIYLVPLKSVLGRSILHYYKTMSQFFEILIFSQNIQGNIPYGCEINLIF